MKKSRQKGKRDKRKSSRKTKSRIVFASIILSVLSMGFIWYELSQFQKSVMSQNQRITELWLNHLIKNGLWNAEQDDCSVTDGVITAVREIFPTSARRYCVIGRGDEILFARDDVMTSEVSDQPLSAFFKGISFEDEHLVKEALGILLDEDHYQIVMTEQELQGESFVFAICTEINYLYRSFGYDICRQQILLHVLLMAFAYISCVVFLTYKNSELTDENEKQQKTMIDQRSMIDQLQGKIESRLNGTTINGEGGLYGKEIVERVLSELTEEQKKKSRKLIVTVDEKEQDVLIQMGVLLDRLLTGMSVGCLWTRNEYFVLLMDMDDAGAMNFARQIIVKYQNTYQKDITATKISIDRLVEGDAEHEI